MAYIGNNLTVQQYAPQIAYFNGNGSQTAFTLPVPVVSAAQIIVAIENVIQNPSASFSVSGSTITFTSAPPSGTNNIWVEYTSLTTAVSVPPFGYSEFAAGTALVFQQTSAPTGWTKVTANDNAALRVVSGVAGTGGSVNFTTAFASQAVSGTVGSYTLTTADIPSHNHSISGSGSTGAMSANNTHSHSGTADLVTSFPQGASNTNGAVSAANTNGTQIFISTNTVDLNHTHTFSFSGTSGSTGSGGGHSHSFTGTAINLAVKYVDVIVATKD
jgi:hypothetical protein